MLLIPRRRTARHRRGCQCEATTRAGRRCTHRAWGGSRYCLWHVPPVSPARAA
jgi:hypothetical protein